MSDQSIVEVTDTPNTPIIDRMAEAMAEHCYSVMEQRGDDAPDIYRRLGMGEWKELAAAALSVIRVPTETMVHYGFEAYLQHETGTEVVPIWQAMVDEAAGKEPFQPVEWPKVAASGNPS